MTGEVATWRMVAARAIIAGLAVSLGVVAMAGVQSPAQGEIPIGATSVPEPIAVSSIAARPPTTVLSEVSVVEAVRGSVAEALGAWGEFAGSGDLADVEGFFDPHGPQWSVLEEESGSTGTSFSVVVEEESLVLEGRSAIFLASVTFVAEGAESLAAEWHIELRMAPDGRWLIWSVRDLADE